MIRIFRASVVLMRGIAGRGAMLVVYLTSLLLAGGHDTRGPTPARTGTRITSKTDAPLAVSVDANYGKRRISFEPNRGQTDSRVDFLARGGGYSLFLEPAEAVFALGKPSSASAVIGSTVKSAAAQREFARALKTPTGIATSTLRMRLVGASPASSVVGESPLSGKVNYYIGNDSRRWLENVPTFGKVRYSGVYPGVDLVYYGTDGQLEYDFIVAPGADPSQIRVAFDGAVPKLDANGDIVLAQGSAEEHAEVHLRNLIVYQENAGAREPVTGRFVLAGDHRVRFAVAEYDRSRALVIDPTVVYATYLAGTGQDDLSSLAVDSKGNAIAVGTTTSTDFPVTSGAYQPTDPNGANSSLFVTKLVPDGSSLVFSTYFGASDPKGASGNHSGTHGNSVAVDPQDNIYVAGETWALNFPTTAGVVQPLLGGYTNYEQFGGSQPDGFVAKLGPTGTLSYATLLGGSNAEAVSAIAVDSAGNAFVTGVTSSLVTTDKAGNPATTELFPTTASAYQRPFPYRTDPENITSQGQYEPFFAELDPTGSKLVYSTLLYPTTCSDHCVDGSTCTINPNTCPTGSCNAYCGGTDYSMAVAIGKAGKVYIGGWTNDPNFPTTAGALQTVAHPNLNANGAGGGSVGFIAAFDPAKSGADSLAFSTFLGGKKYTEGSDVYALATDADGNVYATGQTTSVDFPTTPGSYAPACTTNPNDTRCGAIAFVTKLDPTGALIFSTYLTDPAKPYGYPATNIALDSARNVYVLSGGAGSNTPLVNPVSDTGEASIQTLSADGSKLLFSTLFTGPINAVDQIEGPRNGFVVDNAGSIYVASGYPNRDFPTTAGAFQTKEPADSNGNSGRDSYALKISPIGVAVPTPDGGLDGAIVADGARDGTLGAGGANGADVAGGGVDAAGKDGATGVGGTVGAGGALGGSGGASGKADASGAGGTVGAGGAIAGSGGAGGTSAGPVDADTVLPKDAATDQPKSSGCSCSLASNNGGRPWSLGALFLLATLLLRRRSRRST